MDHFPGLQISSFYGWKENIESLPRVYTTVFTEVNTLAKDETFLLYFFLLFLLLYLCLSFLSSFLNERNHYTLSMLPPKWSWKRDINNFRYFTNRRNEERKLSCFFIHFPYTTSRMIISDGCKMVQLEQSSNLSFSLSSSLQHLAPKVRKKNHSTLSSFRN